MNFILRFSPLFFLFAVALPAEEYRDFIAVNNVLRLYSENYGAVGDKDNLNSVIINGLQIQNGLTYRITIHKKRPNLLRHRLEIDGITLTTTYDGQQAWLGRSERSQVRHRNLSGPGLTAVQAEARFEGPLYRSREKNDTKVSFLRKDQVADIEVLVLRVAERGAPDSLYYIDPKTAYVLQMDQLDEAGEVTFQTLYRDYRLIDGYPFAHEVENRVDGEVVSLTQIESIVVNRGILNMYFSDPTKGHD